MIKKTPLKLLILWTLFLLVIINNTFFRRDPVWTLGICMARGQVSCTLTIRGDLHSSTNLSDKWRRMLLICKPIFKGEQSERWRSRRMSESRWLWLAVNWTWWVRISMSTLLRTTTKVTRVAFCQHMQRWCILLILNIWMIQQMEKGHHSTRDPLRGVERICTQR